MSPSLGQHALLDLHGCHVPTLGDTHKLQAALLAAAEAAKATVLFQYFHHFGEQAGITGVLLLAESHISIHTWTEHAFAAADIFVCGQHSDLQAACQILVSSLQATHYDCHLQSRGLVNDI